MTDPINPKQGSSTDASFDGEPEVDVDTIQDLDVTDDRADVLRGGCAGSKACGATNPA